METIKKGSRGDAVKELQRLLGLSVDGIFGANTEFAVKQFQMKNGLVADGIVGPKTWEKLMNQNPIPGLVIENHFLNAGQYLSGTYKNDYIFLHHTAGGPDAKNVITSWNTDSQGKVATEFVISGINAATGVGKNDGQIIRSFPEGCAGYHLGTTNSSYMNTHSVGIEICSMGNLTKDSNGIYKTYVNSICRPDQVVELYAPFRGTKYYHKYSDKQLESLKKLLLYIADRDNIDLHDGLYKWIKKEGAYNAFEFHQEACDGKVKSILSHSNVRRDKYDVSPQPNLVDMIMSL